MKKIILTLREKKELAEGTMAFCFGIDGQSFVFKHWPVHPYYYVTARPPGNQELDSFQNQQWMHNAILISILRHIPTLNGRSGKSPPGWDLRDMTEPDYGVKVREWITRRHINVGVCRLEIDE